MYEIYRNLSRGLGLALRPAEPGMFTFVIQLTGVVDGQVVEVVRYCGKGAHIVVRSVLPTPLDLGLGVSPTGAFDGMLHWLGAQDVPIGDAAFDAAHTIRGDEPARVAALLGPSVRNELGGFQFLDFKLTDTDFSVRVAVGNESEEYLLSRMRDVARIARVVEAARTAIPPAAALAAHGEAWMAFAREHGLRAERSPLWMYGTLGRATVSARAVRDGASQFTLGVGVALDTPLGTRIDVGPAGGFLSRWAPGVAHPIPSGDAAFDRVFAVRAAEPERVPELFDAEVRGLLLDFHARVGPVFVHDQEVHAHVPAAALDPAQIPTIVDEMRAIVETLGRNAQRAPAAAPAYR